MSRSTEWKQFWNERSVKATSNLNFDRGPLARENEVEHLSQQELLNFIDPKCNEVIFDAGCGTGGNILLLHSKVKRIIGMDYSHGAVERCQQRITSNGLENVGVKQGSITRAPLPDCSVDKILCLSVLQYLDDTEVKSALDEFTRVLKNGGTLVLHVKNLSSIYWSTLWAGKRIKLLLRRQTNLEYLRSFRWYVKKLRTFGFEVVDYNSFNLFMLDRMPVRLLSLLRKLELRNYNRRLFKIGFIRRRGSDLKIKARLQKKM